MNTLRLVVAVLMCTARLAAAQAQDAAPVPVPVPVPAPEAAPAPAPVPLSRFDNQAIAEAIKATVKEMPRLPREPGPADFRSLGEGMNPEKPSKIDQAFTAAEIPSCWRADALKHAPPVIRIAGIPIVFGGILAIPHVLYAASTGKCK